ncbi:uncharacterized protein LY89DRAFT_737669 [Mollisia scopiformis]|uniref:Uncharacterized protein n=1 Tax=Mollisia scopiformis TaxID=149040 RepID=A0A194WXP1_MOLSC|nr:uncharacterized protein LY89DRAFT_737669 [Mollisia scopiformis]KUJ12751.1 hypothetical protein LY89DRAFT_737669 [Mollisia scopiformis]
MLPGPVTGLLSGDEDFATSTLTLRKQSLLPHPPEITSTALRPPRTLLENRDGVNTCSEWSVYGFSSDYVTCDIPYTCLYTSVSSNNYWGCQLFNATLLALTTCHDYSSTSTSTPAITTTTDLKSLSSSSSTTPREKFCDATAPYCINWLISAPSSQFTQFQCTSSLPSSSSQRTLLIVPWPTSATSQIDSVITSTLSPTTMTVMPSPSATTVVEEGGPSSTTLIAAIVETLGGLGAFFLGMFVARRMLRRRGGNSR